MNNKQRGTIYLAIMAVVIMSFVYGLNIFSDSESTAYVAPLPIDMVLDSGRIPTEKLAAAMSTDWCSQ